MNQWQVRAFWQSEFVRFDFTEAVVAPPVTEEPETEPEELTEEEMAKLRQQWYRGAVAQLPHVRVQLERQLRQKMLSLGLVLPHRSEDEPGLRLIYTFSRFHPRRVKLSIPGFFIGLATPIPGGAFAGAYRRTPGFYRLEVRLEDCRGRLLGRVTAEATGKDEAFGDLSRQVQQRVKPYLEALDPACIPKGLYFAGSYLQ